MNKPAKHILTYAGVMAFFAAFLWWMGAWNFMYMEHTRTFYYDWDMIARSLRQPGGVSTVAGDFLIQWFYIPAAAIIINAALLTLLSALTARLMKTLGAPCSLMPLSLIPAISLAVLQCNTNYLYGGSVALVLALAAVCLSVRRDGTPRFRVLDGLILVIVYFACGAAVTVYAVLCSLFAFRRGVKSGLYSTVIPVLALALGWSAVDAGVCASLQRALLPDAYFTTRLPAVSYVYMPWICLGAVLAVSMLPMGKAKKPAVTLCAFAAVAAMLVFSARGIDRDGLTFKRLNCCIRDARWADTEQICTTLPMDNMLWQNFRSLALAEQGRLAEDLFKKQCADIRTIYITGDSNPSMNMLLSDIYYSMGHMALAQRHAFEANESLGNLSPRMLQRLADTNIAFGHYPVAEKYLKLLSKTHRYAPWAEERLQAIRTGVFPADLQAKRQCVFPDNRFSSYRGLDDDLLQVVRCNPAHTATLQYLGCLYLLSYDLPRFKETIDEFLGTPALPGPLPQVFAEGMALYADTDSAAAVYGITPETRARLESHLNAPDKSGYNLWSFLHITR